MMMTMRLAIWVVSYAWLQQGAAPPSTEPTPPRSEQTRYYQVLGRTAYDMQTSIDRNGPATADGRRWAGLTNAAIRWRFGTVQESSGCAVSWYRVDVDIVMTLPSWVEEASASPTLVAHWRRYSTQLLSHEKGHRTISLEAADEIRGALAALTPQSTCDEMQRIANETASALLVRSRERNHRYDVDTRHGPRWVRLW